MPFVALAEGGLEALFEDALFFQVDVAIAVAGSAADGAGIGVLRRRIEEDVVEDLACGLGRDLRLAGDDLETVLEIREGIGVHKGIIEAVCAVIQLYPLLLIFLTRTLLRYYMSNQTESGESASSVRESPLYPQLPE